MQIARLPVLSKLATSPGAVVAAVDAAVAGRLPCVHPGANPCSRGSWASLPRLLQRNIRAKRLPTRRCQALPLCARCIQQPRRHRI
jgi:hypothetical protein